MKNTVITVVGIGGDDGVHVPRWSFGSDRPVGSGAGFQWFIFV
jgi:hypothetical protein